jgi:hypothetical protein
MSARWGPRVAEFCIKPLGGRTATIREAVEDRENQAKNFFTLVTAS